MAENNRLFNRKCSVSIGPNGGTGTKVDQQFRVVFKVNKTIHADANTVNVQIYNLSEETRAALLRDNQVVMIEAGYESGTEVLTIAEVTRSVVVHLPPDIILDVEAADGAKTVRDRKINISFKKGRTVRSVLDAIATELALPIKVTGAQPTGSYAKGVSFSGTVASALDRVCLKGGVIWSIQDGALQISHRTKASNARGVLLTPDTGLIGSPERIDDIEETQSGERKRLGWRVKSLLNPQIRPGDRLQIKSAEVDGAFRAENVNHFGDTEGGDWYTEAEVFEE